MLELFIIGSESVAYYKHNYYVVGPGYEFKVILTDNSYHLSGRPRYKETIDFLDRHLKTTKGAN